MASQGGGECSCCSHQRAVPSTHQTLEEMDFERGIWSAALDGDLGRVESFIKKGTDPNTKDNAGYTSLHYASRGGHESVCELLLGHGACASPQTRGGATPLHRAAYCGHLPVVRLLLKFHADPQRSDDDGATPLHKAAEQGHVEVCELLLRHYPALRTQRDKKSRAPQHLAPVNSPLQQLLHSTEDDGPPLDSSSSTSCTVDMPKADHPP
ncbi:ankyrin repeat domain-containing protein 39 [Alosa alosa]|uniref:ankyrin repeat domain-containing protein 39 n=1 Tax=Alosa alosa TaxID=278164 RepID=UPI0020154929|nr:ankyrin repeat domain-containing protein 39 [Alosa alosa]XP_048098946.1 ankyrin repeat domain-containing protein 39 [Alosa alosa]